jgi:hypothetical protein
MNHCIANSRLPVTQTAKLEERPQRVIDAACEAQ